MIFGNLLALPQRSVKRMLAYSSIAHAGYLLVGVVSAAVAGAREKALAGLLFYLAAYAATAIGAFAVVGALERRARLDDEPADAWDLERFAGLARRRPALAFAMAVFLLSLAGIPPTAGFVGKLYLFQAAVGAQLYGLAILGVLTSVARRLLLPARRRLHVHAPGRGRDGAALVARDGGRARGGGGGGRAARHRRGSGGAARPGGRRNPPVAAPRRASRARRAAHRAVPAGAPCSRPSTRWAAAGRASASAANGFGERLRRAGGGARRGRADPRGGPSPSCARRRRRRLEHRVRAEQVRVHHAAVERAPGRSGRAPRPRWPPPPTACPSSLSAMASASRKFRSPSTMRNEAMRAAPAEKKKEVQSAAEVAGGTSFNRLLCTSLGTR